MSIRNSVDPDALQTLLSNAFAVQESGLDTPVLSLLIEVQRSVQSEQCKLAQVMDLVVEQALRVSNASGVAIGLLDRNKHELVYRAGSGTAANDVGRRVPAVLSVSSAQESRREILRVENAEADPRIQAEICRQFGAMSLLMLPIYGEHSLMGVLQVLFSDAHSFQEREVRAYRLIVAALEEGILRSEHARKQADAAALKQLGDAPVVSQDPQAAAEVTAAVQASPPDAAHPSFPEGTSIGDPDGSEARGFMVLQACQVILRGQLRSLWNAGTSAIRETSIRARAANVQRAWAAGVVVLLLSVSVWMFQSRHFSGTKIGESTSTSRDSNFPAPQPTLLVSQDLKDPATIPTEAASFIPAFKRVRVGPNEVDYIAEDVTIRTFERKSSKPQIRNAAHEVNFGNDVTVRYFAKSPALTSHSASAPTADPDTN